MLMRIQGAINTSKVMTEPPRRSLHPRGGHTQGSQHHVLVPAKARASEGHGALNTTPSLKYSKRLGVHFRIMRVCLPLSSSSHLEAMDLNHSAASVLLWPASHPAPLLHLHGPVSLSASGHWRLEVRPPSTPSRGLLPFPASLPSSRSFGGEFVWALWSLHISFSGKSSPSRGAPSGVWVSWAAISMGRSRAWSRPSVSPGSRA